MKIEELKDKFKYDLIGRWVSCNGTFINVINEVWEFFSNGTGRTISSSVMSGQDTERFKWRRKDLCCIEIAITDPEFDEPDIWREVCYDFCLVPTDYGFLPALIEIDKGTALKKEGFGLMEVPLSYDGEVN